MTNVLIYITILVSVVLIAGWSFVEGMKLATHQSMDYQEQVALFACETSEVNLLEIKAGIDHIMEKLDEPRTVDERQREIERLQKRIAETDANIEWLQEQLDPRGYRHEREKTP